MIDPLSSSMRVASSALYAQTQRIRIVSENIANAQTTAQEPGGDPYRRKTISFSEAISQADGTSMVSVKNIGRDPSTFKQTYDPGHPAADEKGFVKTPNVDPIVELADLREANRSYQANVQVIKQTRDLLAMTIDLLKP